MTTRKRNNITLLIVLAIVTTCTAIFGVEKLLPGKINDYAILAGAIGGSMVVSFAVGAFLWRKE